MSSGAGGGYRRLSLDARRLDESAPWKQALNSFAGWFALVSFPLTARPQVSTAIASLAPTAAPVALAAAAPEAPAAPAPDAVESAPAAAPTPCEPQAYVPDLLPVFFQVQLALPESAYSLFGEEGAFFESVRTLVTVGPDGRVTGAEALSGLEILRQPAINAVLHFKYRPAIRYGQPVCALTAATTSFPTPGKRLTPRVFSDEDAARQRLRALENQWPRSAEQVLADMQEDRDFPGGIGRRLALPALAKAALAAGSLDQAVAYAQEALNQPSGPGPDAIFNCNTVLGLVALRNGDVAAAKQYLIASGKTPGSAALNSLGPNMSLAKELLDRGERDAVLEFFSLCRVFWANHAQLLDSWSETVRREHLPDFGANLKY